MNKDLLEQHFQKSGFDAMRSEALATVFELYREEMATKQDIALLRAEFKSELRTEIAGLRGEVKSDIAGLRGDLKSEIGALTGELTWRFIALVVFLATITSLVGIFA